MADALDLATGTGKTFIAYQLAKRLYDAKRGGQEKDQSLSDNKWKDWNPKQSSSSSSDQRQKPERDKKASELSVCASCHREYSLAPVKELCPPQ